MVKVFLVSSLLTVGINEYLFRQAQAQAIWRTTETPKAQSSPLIWRTSSSNSEKPEKLSTKWEVIPEPEHQNQTPLGVVWEILKNEDEVLPTPQKRKQIQSSSRQLT